MSADLSTAAILAPIIDGLRKNGHGKVLVVGCRGDNFDADWRANPQFVFWNGDASVTGTVPQAAKLILVTRFLPHTGYGRLRKEATRMGITFHPNTLGTGEIKDLLRPLMAAAAERAAAEASEAVLAGRRRQASEFGEAPPTEAEREAALRAAARPPDLRSWARYEMREFLINHAHLDAVPHSIEAERLRVLALSLGVSTTTDSLKQGMYILRKEREEIVKPTKVATPAPPAPSVAQPIAIAPLATAAAKMTDSDAEILRMLDDVAAAVALIRATVIERSAKQLKLEQIKKLMEEV